MALQEIKVKKELLVLLVDLLDLLVLKDPKAKKELLVLLVDPLGLVVLVVQSDP